MLLVELELVIEAIQYRNLMAQTQIFFIHIITKTGILRLGIFLHFS